MCLSVRINYLSSLQNKYIYLYKGLLIKVNIVNLEIEIIVVLVDSLGC